MALVFGPPENPNSIAFLGNGRLILVDFNSNPILRSSGSHRDTLYDVEWNPNPVGREILVTASGDGLVTLWALQSKSGDLEQAGLTDKTVRN